MTLSREEIAVRLAASLLTGYASRGPVSVDRNRLACDAIHYADGLLLALPPTPAPVAPPAGKYVPAVGDIVIGLFGDDGLARVDSVDPTRWSALCDGTWRSGFRFGVTSTARLATDAEKRAAGLAVPPPATASEGLDDIERSAQALADFKGTIPPGASDAFMLGWRVRDREAPCDGVARTTNAPTTPAPEAKRPTHVRYTAPISTDKNVVRRVIRWAGENPVVGGAGGGEVDENCPVELDPGEWEPAPCPPPVAGSAEKDEAFKALLAYAECEEAAWGCGELEPTLVLHGKKRNEHAHEFLKRLRTKALALSRPVRP